jgi:Bacterial protein of unknown function (DUF899)
LRLPLFPQCRETEIAYRSVYKRQPLPDIPDPAWDARRLAAEVTHFMFDPAWDKGCSGCTGFIDALGNLALLNARDTTFVVVSRAPLAKLEAYKALKG